LHPFKLQVSSLKLQHLTSNTLPSRSLDSKPTLALFRARDHALVLVAAQDQAQAAHPHSEALPCTPRRSRGKRPGQRHLVGRRRRRRASQWRRRKVGPLTTRQAVLTSVVESSRVSLGVSMSLIFFLVYLSGHWLDRRSITQNETAELALRREEIRKRKHLS
jgi:hypothetical protein